MDEAEYRDASCSARSTFPERIRIHRMIGVRIALSDTAPSIHEGKAQPKSCWMAAERWNRSAYPAAQPQDNSRYLRSTKI